MVTFLCLKFMYRTSYSPEGYIVPILSLNLPCWGVGSWMNGLFIHADPKKGGNHSSSLHVSLSTNLNLHLHSKIGAMLLLLSLNLLLYWVFLTLEWNNNIKGWKMVTWCWLYYALMLWLQLSWFVSSSVVPLWVVVLYL